MHSTSLASPGPASVATSLLHSPESLAMTFGSFRAARPFFAKLKACAVLRRLVSVSLLANELGSLGSDRSAFCASAGYWMYFDRLFAVSRTFMTLGFFGA